MAFSLSARGSFRWGCLFTAGELPPDTFFAPIPDTLYHLNLLGDGAAGEEVYGTPWRTGVEQTYGASLRGGLESVTYFLSGEFSRREGSLPNNEATQRNVRANFNLVPSDNVEIAVSTGYSNNEVALPDNDNNAFSLSGHSTTWQRSATYRRSSA